MVQRHHRLLGFSALILLGLIMIGLWNPTLLRQTRVDAEPEVNSISNEPIKWNRHIHKGKYQTFRKLAEAIRENVLDVDSRGAFAFLQTDQQAMQRIDELLAKLSGDDRSASLSALFAELMNLPSDPDILFECASSDIATVFENGRENPERYGMYFSWGLSRPMIACIMSYEATGQVRFLELMAETYERALPFRDSELGRKDEVRGRAMHNWGTDKYAGDGRYSAEVTTASRVSYPIARWIKIVRSDSALQERFGSQADRFLKLIKQTIDDYEGEFRWVEGSNQGYYLNVPKNQAEALNHMAWAGNLHLTLWQLTGEEKHLRMAQGIANYFKASMWTDENGCLVWNYQPQPGSPRFPPEEFAWKARTTIDLPLYFAANNEVFTEAELTQISKTFTTNIYRSTGKWNALITSEYRDPAEIEEYNGGTITLSPFIQLADYDPKIRELVEQSVAGKSTEGGWLHRTHGLVAYAYRLQSRK